MKLLSQVFPYLIVFLAVSCSQKMRISKAYIDGLKQGSWYRAEQDDQWLMYSIHEDDNRYIIKIYSDSKLMMARIVLLGMQVTFGKKKNATAIRYPMGILELHAFRSGRQMLDFWSASNTTGIWRSRIYRNQHTMYLINCNGSNGYAHKDSIDQINTAFTIEDEELNIELVILKEVINQGHSEINLSIGVLSVGGSEQLRRLSGIARRYPVLNFTEEWEVSVKTHSALEY